MTEPKDDFVAWTIREFRAHHGRVGGPFEGAPLLLLHTKGARSGTARVNPMMYLPDDDRYLVFASNGGSDRNPAWYHNLKADPDARIEVGDLVLDVRARELTGDERTAIYDEQAARYPGFAGYRDATDRVIPVIALEPRRSAPLTERIT